MLIRITAAVLTCCAVMSCVDDSAVALALLDTLDRSRLRTRGAKARHALLYSQALDKNWIDLSTDSIIKPAVRYYARHGSPDDRLKAQYYLGRIYQNAGDNESAMRCFVNAEKYASKCDDAGMAGRLYTAMTAIYYSIYQFEMALEASANAADYYLLDADTNWYAYKMITAANISLFLKDTVKAQEYLDKVRPVFQNISDEERGYYFGEYLKTLPKDSVMLIRTTLDEDAYQNHVGRIPVDSHRPRIPGPHSHSLSLASDRSARLSPRGTHPARSVLPSRAELLAAVIVYLGRKRRL